jgi:hypothetical protein
MKAILTDVASFIGVAALIALHGYLAIKRAQSRRKEDGGIQTLFGTKKSK